MRMKIADFFDTVSRDGGEYEVKTPQGWKKLGDLYLKRQKECYLLRVESGKSLGCSADHIVMTESGWKPVGKLNVETDSVETSDGFESISANEYLGKMDTYDWEVLSDEHAYYANGIVSHNTGKTALVKQCANRPVMWAHNGNTPKEYPGHAVFNVPIAQFEEMGDLHGLPSRHIRVVKEGLSRWVPEEVLQGYFKDGWEVMQSAGVRTMYAPPDWVPSEPGPAILLLDDWNRASVRIIKGIMQLLQNYGMVSWKLPPGCNIVLTANPDEQDYLVTSIDNAILTRIRSGTLKHDAKEWAIWATQQDLDRRGINFLLQYPEMMIGPERTNPRTLAQFFRDIKRIPNLATEDNQKRFRMMAASLLDEQTVSSMMVFMERDVEMVIEPEQILKGKEDDWKFIRSHMERMMAGREKRIDVVSVICDRLFAFLVQPTTKADKKSIENFQKFITMTEIPEDLRHNLCLRMSKYKKSDGANMHPWLMANAQLAKMIMSVV